MNKSELVKKIAKKHKSTSAKEVQEVVSIVFEQISGALEAKQRVEIRGLGSLSLRERKAREAKEARASRHTPPRAAPDGAGGRQQHGARGRGVRLRRPVVPRVHGRGAGAEGGT